MRKTINQSDERRKKTKPTLQTSDFFQKNEYYNLIHLIHYCNNRNKKIKKKHLKGLVSSFFNNISDKEKKEIKKFYELPYKKEVDASFDSMFKKKLISKKDLDDIHNLKFITDELEISGTLTKDTYPTMERLNYYIHMLKKYDMIDFKKDKRKRDYHYYILTKKCNYELKKHLLKQLINNIKIQDIDNKFFEIIKIIN